MQAVATVLDGVEYHPSEDEPFMNDRQLEYFKIKLQNWKEDILRESRETVTHLQAETENHPDLADRASSETDRALELRTRDRQRKLISKIDDALRRIEEYVLPLESARVQVVYGGPSAVNRVLILNAEPHPGRGTVLLLREAIGY